MIEINAWMILVQLISFLVLMAFLGRFLFAPLANFIEKRRKEIDNTFSIINREREQASSLIEEADKRLRKAEEEAKEIIERAVKEGERLKDEILKEAKKEGERLSESLINNAKQQIKRERQNAISYINKISVAIASKLIKESIDEGKQERLLSEFIEEIKEEDIR